MPRLTVHRALLDWFRRPKEAATAGVDPRARFRESEEDKPKMPGVVGMTGHRLILDIQDSRVGDRLVTICNEALDAEISEGMRSAITNTRDQILAAIGEL
jgi:hypothetical protein